MYRMGRGDYIPGYYRGDPGFFSAVGHILGSAVKVVGGAALGYLTGGGVKGAIAGAVGGSAEATSQGIQRETLAAGGSQSALTPALRQAHAAALARGPLPAIRPGGTPALMLGPGGGIPSGRVPRPSGKGFYTRRHLAALAKGLTRARPRMNPFNPSALRRAARRAHSFLRMSRKLVRYYVGKQRKGKAYISHRRKK